LFEAVNCLANSFLSLGLKRGDRIAVQTGTGIGHIFSLLALTKVGMAIVPIDRTYMADEITYQIQDSGSRGFIVDADIYQTKIKDIKSRFTSVEHFI
jgi:acyl-CoA synthetase (AMP-forming)/AMP-acid ligase II